MVDEQDGPAIGGANLALRFGLELASIAGVAVGGWSFLPVAGVVAPVVAVGCWGTFNVPGDPSRSGRAPVEVPGAARIAVEAGVLGAGVAGWVVAGRPAVGAILGVLTVADYATTTSRLRWLLER